MRRNRKAKVVATLGPATSSPETIRKLFETGVDVFRFNFSHGSTDDHRARMACIRAIERDSDRPIGVLADLQGPKLRIARFRDGSIQLRKGQTFHLTLGDRAGDAQGIGIPHPEIFAALKPGVELLLDDGRLRLQVEQCGPEFANTRVLTGGPLSDHKGVNVPDAVLPLSALTDKDRRDLEVALELGADWIALSFVQQPGDIEEIKSLIGDRAGIVAKLEKPAALENLDQIISLADAVMVARGDLGVEVPAEQVPAIQKQIIRHCRAQGKPVIVATQMLESMVSAPVPTRAEASDVATAIYDGADAVMLSAESAVGSYPMEAVQMMDRILTQVESDPEYRQLIEASHSPAQQNTADAICCAMRRAVQLLDAAVTVSFTSSGYTSLRAARERPEASILSLTPHAATARRLCLAWGIHSVQTDDVANIDDVVSQAQLIAREQSFAESGDMLVIMAGMPVGQAGQTNFLRVAQA